MFKKKVKEQIKVPAHTDYLADLRDFITDLCTKHGFSDKVSNAFKLTVDEAATNVIRHAYKDREGEITLRAIVRKRSLTLHIIDQGVYFDPNLVKNPDLNKYVQTKKKGGLGIFIMRKLMDEIDYRKTREGNELRVTKYRYPKDKKGVLASSHPWSLKIKLKYFLRAMTLVFVIIASVHLYIYLKSSKQIFHSFLQSGHQISHRVNGQLIAFPTQKWPETAEFIETILKENTAQVFQILILDSTGAVIINTHKDIFQRSFVRPDKIEKLENNVYKFVLESAGEIFDIEKPIVNMTTRRNLGTSHVLLSGNYLQMQINFARQAQIKNVLIFAVGAVIVTGILVFVLANPFLSALRAPKKKPILEEAPPADLPSPQNAANHSAKDLSEPSPESLIISTIDLSAPTVPEQTQNAKPKLIESIPTLPDIEISYLHESTNSVCGDYFEFLEMGEDLVALIVAECEPGEQTSKIIQAIKKIAHEEMKGIQDAGKMLAHIATHLKENFKLDQKVTAFYLILDLVKRQINYASAGHPPIILYRVSTDQTFYLNPEGAALGIAAESGQKMKNQPSFASESLQLLKNDLLIIYTSGATEVTNARNEHFGKDRLLNLLYENSQNALEQFIDKIKIELQSFSKSRQQKHDITLIVLREKFESI